MEHNRVEEEVRNTTKVLMSRTTGFILAALGFVVGLAWNDAIQELVKTIFPQEQNTIIAKFIYAFIITVALVLISLRLDRKEK